MLTKKENLLIRPFVLQKYQNHRRKVAEAGAVIDFQCPTKHPHVTLKLKKLQREQERLQEIERENQRLLTKLGQIMNKNRLENFWKEPRPNFVNRVLIPSLNRRSKSAPSSTASTIFSNNQNILQSPIELNGRQSARCSTCTKTYVKRTQLIPEERVPWTPPTKSWNQKIQNNNIKSHKCCKFCC